MSGAIRKFPAVLLVLGGLCGCTYWTTDFERIVDQTGRDFKIDPDKNYKRVALSEIVAHPSSFKLVDVRFQAIMNRRDEQVFTAFYTTFRQEDYISFSLWPVEAQLWEQSDRLKSLPTFYIRKDNPHIQEMLDTRRYALVDVRARVMGDYDQIPWFDVFYVDEIMSVAYTEQSLIDYREGMEAYSKNMPAPAVEKLEAAVKAPLAPKASIQAHLALAKIYEGRGDIERASVQYDAVLMLDENNEIAWEGWERTQKALEAKHAAEGPAQPATRKKVWP